MLGDLEVYFTAVRAYLWVKTQKVLGSIAASGTLTLQSTSHATRGNIVTDCADITMVAASRMRMAGQNSFRYLNLICKVGKNANQTIPNATQTTLAWQVEEIDTSSMHDTSSNNSRIIAPIAGKYLCICVTRWTANGTGERFQTFRVNGAVDTYPAVGSDSISSAANVARVTSVGLLSLAANDYVEVIVVQSSGGDLDVDNGGDDPKFTMVYLGE